MYVYNPLHIFLIIIVVQERELSIMFWPGEHLCIINF
jgi:hypothetical protein